MRGKGEPARLRLFRKWRGQLEFEGKLQYLGELEIWLKSFERYFCVTNLPLSEEETRQLTLRDYSEELKAVHDVIFRIAQICTLMLSEEQVSYLSFSKYIENSLRQSFLTDNYRRKIENDPRPQQNLNMLMEALLDMRSIISELSKLRKNSYVCFTSIGRAIDRELIKRPFFLFFLDKKYSSFFDRVQSRDIMQIVHSIQNPVYKRSIASVFLESYRIFRYLNCISLQMEDAKALKRSLLIFSLIAADVKLLLLYLEEQFLKKEHPDGHFGELIEGIVYSLSMELKKVMQKELLGTAALQQYELIFTKVQNSQGILANALQQVVFSLAQFFDPKLKGHEIFPDYVTKLEQSLKLRSDIYKLSQEVKAFSVHMDLARVDDLVKKIEWFKASSMRFLMYKDWFDFDNFYLEIRECKSSGNLGFSLHRFETFLNMLIKEVNKRAILYDHPFTPPTASSIKPSA